MKVLLIQNSGLHETNKHLRESITLRKGFESNGIDCHVYHPNTDKNFTNFNDYDFVIDMLELYDKRDEELLKSIKCKKILWVCDAHVNGEAPYIRLFKNLNYQSIMKHSTNLFLDINSFWVNPWFDSNHIRKKESIAKKNFIGFCGNRHNFRNEELNYIQSLGGKLDIFVLGEKMVNSINSYIIHFNKNLHPNHGMSYRVVETLACDTCLLTNSSDMNDLLGMKHMENCLIYSSFEHLKELINWSLNNLDKIKTISSNGYALSQKFDHQKTAERIENILREKI